MILVLSTYRSASTWYCSDLADRYQLTNFGEAFHEANVSNHKRVLRSLAGNTNSVVKIFPYHLTQSNIALLFNHLVNLASDIHVVIRKNFDEQLRSYYVAKDLRNWHDSVNASITFDLDKWNRYKDFLYLEHVQLAQLTKNIDADIEFKYAEMFDQSQKYSRTIEWDCDPPETNLDIMSLYQ